MPRRRLIRPAGLVDGCVVPGLLQTFVAMRLCRPSRPIRLDDDDVLALRRLVLTLCLATRTADVFAHRLVVTLRFGTRPDFVAVAPLLLRCLSRSAQLPVSVFFDTEKSRELPGPPRSAPGMAVCGKFLRDIGFPCGKLPAYEQRMRSWPERRRLSKDCGLGPAWTRTS